MEVVKQTGDYKIIKKRSGRYGVRAKDGKWINGNDKAEILSKEGLIQWTKPKAPPAPEAAEAESAPAEEAPAAEEEKAAE